MILEITQILNSLSPKWAFFLSDGKVIRSTLEDDQLGKMLRVLKTVINEIEVGNVFIVKNLVIYRITFNFFIFILKKGDRPKIKEKLTQITRKYKDYLEEEFDKLAGVKEIKVNLVLLSMGLAEGPAPIIYIPPEFDEGLVLKVCMKSMLLLTMEGEGANKDMLSFQPYVELDSLGLVFIFQIEDSQARGGAYDAALTILVDYEDRALVYENYGKIETFLKQSKERILRAYQSDKNYAEVLEDLRVKVSDINFETVREEDIKTEMMEQIKKLTKL